MSAHRGKADLAFARASRAMTYASEVRRLLGHQSSICPKPKARWSINNLLRESPCRCRRLIPMSPIPSLLISAFTVYDEEHVITYLRLLDADAVGADWSEVARIVLHLDPKRDSDRA